MRTALQDWNEQWATPSTRIEHVAPVLAFVLAVILAQL